MGPPSQSEPAGHGFGVWGFRVHGFIAEGSEFRGLGVQGLGSRVLGVLVSGFRVLGVLVSGFGVEDEKTGSGDENTFVGEDDKDDKQDPDATRSRQTTAAPVIDIIASLPDLTSIDVATFPESTAQWYDSDILTFIGQGASTPDDFKPLLKVIEGRIQWYGAYYKTIKKRIKKYGGCCLRFRRVRCWALGDWFL